tara:strand:- start:63 stop:446 length:384 start_codon:yes stop_codon:yes gene_type:complete
MEAVIIITVLALLQYVYFGYQVGAMRGQTGVKAPATSGDPMFERVNRVHQNTLEQLVFVLPVMWIYANAVSPIWAAGFGAIYIIGRFIYSAAYRKDPGSRSIGFTMSLLPGAIMAGWVLIVAVKTYF